MDIQRLCEEKIQNYPHVTLAFEQSNHEGQLIDCLQYHFQHKNLSNVIINAGAYTHTSIALLDALLSVAVPYVEIHLSNIFAREAFRHHSYLSQNAKAVLCGLGEYSYLYALDFLCHPPPLSDKNFPLPQNSHPLPHDLQETTHES